MSLCAGMNGDLISRSELLDEIYGNNRPEVYDGQDIANWQMECINSAPAVDAEPVRHGKWVWDEVGFKYTCSECKCDFDYSTMYGLFDHGFAYAGYCPNCGAKMRGDEHEAD